MRASLKILIIELLMQDNNKIEVLRSINIKKVDNRNKNVEGERKFGIRQN